MQTLLIILRMIKHDKYIVLFIIYIFYLIKSMTWLGMLEESGIESTEAKFKGEE